MNIVACASNGHNLPINEMESRDIAQTKNNATKRNRKMERKKEEVRRRLSRDFNCLKKMSLLESICLTEQCTDSIDDTEDDSEESGPNSVSTQPPTSESRWRKPPKYLSARQVWLKKDLSVDNPYRKFFQKANNPKWHPSWRPPSPPTGWALHKAHVDRLIDDLACWMKEELETPGYKSTASIDAESLRQMFELDLDGFAARKVKVQPRELRCLRITERPAKRHEKSNATQLPESVSILFRVKQAILNDISRTSGKSQSHAFGTHLPQGHAKREHLETNTERDRWIVGRKAHPELSDWSAILSGMNNTFIGTSFFRYVNENYPEIPTETRSAHKIIHEISRLANTSPKFLRQKEQLKRNLRRDSNIQGDTASGQNDSAISFTGNLLGEGISSYHD